MTNPLPKSMRDRNRYIAYEIIQEDPGKLYDKKIISRTISREILNFLGELGASRASARLIRYDPKKRQGIFKVCHTDVDGALCALALIRSIDNDRVIFNVLKISGTIKGCSQ